MAKHSGQLPARTLYSTPLAPFRRGRLAVRGAIAAGVLALSAAALGVWHQTPTTPLAFPHHPIQGTGSGEGAPAPLRATGSGDLTPGPLLLPKNRPAPEKARAPRDRQAPEPGAPKPVTPGRPTGPRPVAVRPSPPHHAKKPVKTQPAETWIARECARRFPHDPVRRSACQTLLDGAYG